MTQLPDWNSKIGAWGTSLLRCLPAELAHDIGMWALKHQVLDYLPQPSSMHGSVNLSTEIGHLGHLPHPFLLAAGFDKHCLAPGAFFKMGFAGVELGTVTPQPQPGNPKPRMFRHEDTRSLINRMGFNSDGHAVVHKRLKNHRDSLPRGSIVGVNLGKNKVTAPELAVNDFLQGLHLFDAVSDYLVINISSPNTPGLRALARPDFITSLAGEARSFVNKTWIKLDPDIERHDFQAIVHAITDQDFAGFILSNTHRVDWPQAGGLSGHPLLSQSNTVLEWAWEVHRGLKPMMASGGVLSGIDAYQKIIRGACAVQLYSALVYRGPGAVLSIHTELQHELKLHGFSTMSEAIGVFYDQGRHT
jgi:dihydroorotate dehydrogenase